MKKIISSPWIRRILLFVLVLTMAFGTVLAPEANAATKYKVKSWRSGEYYYYCIFTGKPKKYNAHFGRSKSDQFKSGSAKINFYTQYRDVNDKMVDAMLTQIGDTSKQRYTYWNVKSGDDYYPHIILGWYTGKESVKKLTKRSPFVNNEGIYLYIEKVGNGNVEAQYANDSKYSWVVYYKKDNMTIGYRFVDEEGRKLNMRGIYFPY